MATTTKVITVIARTVSADTSPMARKWPRSSYKTRKWDAGRVRVMFELGGVGETKPPDTQWAAKKLDDARDALLAAGFRVEIGQGAFDTFWLIVGD